MNQETLFLNVYIPITNSGRAIIRINLKVAMIYITIIITLLMMKTLQQLLIKIKERKINQKMETLKQINLIIIIIPTIETIMKI